MSAFVGFSDGSDWSIGQRGWDRLLDRTREKLRAEGLDSLQWEIFDYGVDFDAHPEHIRAPLARALLAAARELQIELGAQEGWDAGKGPYFGNLVAFLERESAV
ncbi:hypothetical protein ACFYXS_08715 [Streptomyces sp. NPDC002574]|uniref:hypothetical protein n=1 Tax=Streptomyces sp. NPDC002574 TaxID=3364652 RepID=UPI00368AD323